MNKQPQQQLNIDIKTTTPIKSPEGNMVFQEGVILRKVSKFIAGTAEDGVIPPTPYFSPSLTLWLDKRSVKRRHHHYVPFVYIHFYR